MAFRARIWLLGMVACAVVAISAPAAQGAFEVERFFAANCKVATCNNAVNSTPQEELEKARAEGYTQASGHPPFGITDFVIKSHVIQTVPFEARAPEGSTKNIRVDVAPGVSTNPEAVKKCSVANFTGTELEPAPGLHAFTAPNCPESEIGTNIAHVVVEVATGVFENFEFTGAVYNLEQPTGLSSYFGVALNLQPLLGVPLYSHVLIEGHVDWAKDYHDYFIIKNVTPGLIESRLIFNGDAGNLEKGAFLSNPSACLGAGPQTTTGLSLESYEGASASSSYTTAIGTEGCNGLPPFELAPFAPTIGLTPETAQSDQPDGITTQLNLPHDPNPAHLDSSQLKTATVVLPEGMTLNPSAAPDLQVCTAAEIGIKTENPVTCPEKSKVGEVSLNVPGLPDDSLQGNVYLGVEGPGAGPIAGPPYVIYIDAESARYGLSVRLKGEVVPNATTGQVVAKFNENPEQPFTNLILHFKGGPLAPIANPLGCGPASATSSLVPYTGTPAAVTPSSAPFSVTGCASPLPFSLAQSTSSSPTTGGTDTSFTFNLTRADGQQYLSKVSTTLPAGLVGRIPAVPLCPEPAASLGACPSTSQIGTTSVLVGSGPKPVQFNGTVYLTGPVGKAPYGMTFEIPTAIGPFNFGTEIVRAGIEVDPITARITVSSTLPTVIKGVPLRLKSLSVAINKGGFLVNPTNCGALTTNGTLTSTLGATLGTSTPFQATNCTALSFKPKFTASSNAKTSRANGASLNVKIGYPAGAQANIKSVLVTVPKQLPSRLTTLKKACLEATFNANPYACPKTSRVGGATVTTPVLPGKLTGPVYFVSHGGAAFPDLDVVLSGDGVTVILVGNTNIKNGITTSNFAAIPDVPVSSFALKLPIGSNSAVTAATGNLCKQPLVMPTTITAQNGKVIKQNTRISVSGCGVRIVSRRISKGHAVVTVKTPAAGRVSAGGKNLKTVYRRPGKAEKLTISVPLSRAGRKALAAHGRLSVSVRVGFVPKAKDKSSSAHTTVVFK
jgi:hypothetical protein